MPILTIKWIGSKAREPHHVGNEWEYFVRINDECLEKGKEWKIISTNGEYRFHLYVIENDKVSDKKRELYIKDYNEIARTRFFLPVTVEENRGRFVGSTAIIDFFFEAT